ncbi:hypothetical protein MKJ01_02490 [Chryseobacterium sp. SSA4.19]|uniref:hypothetical protein n=1 Tax=Chryseobacterium sp. SSA4.19 TaxID=2919915 RepID=UPI001F4ED426|nr:hypothetical protein [Chryseobacterium sp. SSA4.19]MCJ8152629.1 hypothetical protein [Chryseobacterium sp. SSA4.19]
MKIKIVNTFKLNDPSKIIFDVEIIEGQKITKGQKFINSDNNIEFIIFSVGHVNPPISNYYPLIVNVSSTDISKYKNKIFVLV